MLYVDRGCHEVVVIQPPAGQSYEIIVDQISIESGSRGVAVIEVIEGKRTRCYPLEPGEFVALPHNVELMVGHIKISADRNRVANGSVRLLFNAPRQVEIIRKELLS